MEDLKIIIFTILYTRVNTNSAQLFDNREYNEIVDFSQRKKKGSIL